MMRTIMAFLLALACSGALAQQTEKEAWPEAIMDNSFLIEEAYNQDPGVVQWIFNSTITRPDNSWLFTFTNEWPVPDEKNQLSYMVQWAGEGSGQPSGFGDLFLNYRYQLFFEEKDGVAVAPRLSVILPTGDWRRGLGSGTTGWQASIPFSKRVSQYFAIHFNLGATLYPRAKSLDLSGNEIRRSLKGTNEGASVIYLASPVFNIFLEAVAYQQQQFTPSGGKTNVHQALICPGFRCAVNKPKGQLVWGVSAPIGLTHASPHSGVFLYLSWEAPVWKAK